MIPAAGDTEQPHPDPAANRGRSIVVQVGDGPYFLEAVGETTLEDSAGGLGGISLSPAVWVKLPADLDLTVAIGQGLEQHRPAGRPEHSSTTAQDPNRGSVASRARLRSIMSTAS